MLTRLWLNECVSGTGFEAKSVLRESYQYTITINIFMCWMVLFAMIARIEYAKMITNMAVMEYI